MPCGASYGMIVSGEKDQVEDTITTYRNALESLKLPIHKFHNIEGSHKVDDLIKYYQVNDIFTDSEINLIYERLNEV